MESQTNHPNEETGHETNQGAGALMGANHDVAIPPLSMEGEALLRYKEDKQQPLPSLVGANLAGLDLSHANFSGLDFSGADLSQANLTDTLLMGAQFVGAKLCSATCHRTEFAGSQMQNVDLQNADLRNAGLGHVNLTEATLEGANLEGACLASLTATGANFQMCNLSKARIHDADLTACSFARASFEEAQLDRANVSQAYFFHANVKGASLQSLQAYNEANWVGVDTHAANPMGARLLIRFVRDQNYLAEFKSQSKWHNFIYWVWWASSDCGRSLMRWGLLTGTLVFLFAGLYSAMDMDYGDHPTAVSTLYFSVATMTTLGYGDVVPASVVGQCTSMIQVSIGYLMLGGLVSILSNKLARRAD